MKQKNEKKKLNKKNEKRDHYDINNSRIFSVNRAMISISGTKARVVFFNHPSLKKSGVSKIRQCPIEIRMTTNTWFDILEELSAKTIVHLVQNKRKNTSDCPKERPPEVMFS